MGKAALTLKGIHTVKLPGPPVRWYVYAWRGGPKIMATIGGAKPALDAAALAAYARAIDERRQKSPDTLAGIATGWRASAAWASMAPSTRQSWGLALATIERKWGIVPTALFDDRRMKAKIIDWRDTMASTPRKADYHIQVLRALLAYGKLTGRLSVNLAEGIPGLYRGGNRATILWEPAEVERWQDCANQAVRDAFNLARLTGLRRADLIAVPLSAIGHHAIIWKTSKSRGETTVTAPMLPALADLIANLKTRARAPGVDTLLVTSRGKPWTPAGLTASFTTERDRLGLPDKHLHDVRGTYCTELCEAELTDRQIADLMGWSPEKVATIRRVYVDGARTVVAIGERLSNRGVKLSVKQSSNKHLTH